MAWTRQHSLNLILWLTGSQCRWIRVGVTCSKRLKPNTSRAAAFWTRCRLVFFRPSVSTVSFWVAACPLILILGIMTVTRWGLKITVKGQSQVKGERAKSPNRHWGGVNRRLQASCAKCDGNSCDWAWPDVLRGHAACGLWVSCNKRMMIVSRRGQWHCS